NWEMITLMLTMFPNWVLVPRAVASMVSTWPAAGSVTEIAKIATTAMQQALLANIFSSAFTLSSTSGCYPESPFWLPTVRQYTLPQPIDVLLGWGQDRLCQCEPTTALPSQRLNKECGSAVGSRTCW